MPDMLTADGHIVTLRPVGAADAAALTDLHARLTRPASADHHAMLAQERGHVIGAASYERLGPADDPAGQPAVAEFGSWSPTRGIVRERRREMKKWTVRDVMTHEVVTVRFATSYHDIVSLMAARGVSAVPVVDDMDRVLGVVSEADLLRKIEYGSEDAPRFYEWGTRKKEKVKAHGGTAAELMSTPAVTVLPTASLTSAAKMLDRERVKRLPVVNDLGRLVGIVSRSDLLSVYLRPDDAIREDIVEDVLKRVLQLGPAEVQAEVVEGIATLTGELDRKSTAHIAVHLTRAVPGVIDVVDKLSFAYDDTVVSATASL